MVPRSVLDRRAVDRAFVDLVRGGSATGCLVSSFVLRLSVVLSLDATRAGRRLDRHGERVAGLRRERPVGREHEIALELADGGVDLAEAVGEQHAAVEVRVGMVGIGLHRRSRRVRAVATSCCRASALGTWPATM